MEYKIVSSENCDRLIIFFAGWGMDDTPFRKLRRAGYDVAVIWDYTSFAIDWSFTNKYVEICIVAWSFGVYASAVSTHSIDGKVTKRIALNGTLFPCDRRCGIPPRVFEGTLAGLDARNMLKFYRRMCGSAEVYDAFCESLPERSIESLRCELETFSPDSTLLYQPITRFDIAIIGRDDAIIPAANQWRAWADTPTVFYDSPHLLDFQYILDHFILDKLRVEERFSCGFESYESEAVVQSAIIAEIKEILNSKDILSKLNTPGCRVLEVGSGTGMLSRHLDNVIKDGYFEMWDIAGKQCVCGNGRCFRQVDAEIEIAKSATASFDVIATASTVQWFNSPGRFLQQCHRVLARGGYLVISSFLKGNLAEVSNVTGRNLPLLSLKQWQKTIPHGFEVIEILSKDLSLHFDTAIDVFRHLKATGVNGLGRNSEGEMSLHNIIKNYHPGLDGRYHITYRPFIMILKKK